MAHGETNPHTPTNHSPLLEIITMPLFINGDKLDYMSHTIYSNSEQTLSPNSIVANSHSNTIVPHSSQEFSPLPGNCLGVGKIRNSLLIPEMTSPLSPTTLISQSNITSPVISTQLPSPPPTCHYQVDLTHHTSVQSSPITSPMELPPRSINFMELPITSAYTSHLTHPARPNMSQYSDAPITNSHVLSHSTHSNVVSTFPQYPCINSQTSDISYPTHTPHVTQTVPPITPIEYST